HSWPGRWGHPGLLFVNQHRLRRPTRAIARQRRPDVDDGFAADQHRRHQRSRVTTLKVSFNSPVAFADLSQAFTLVRQSDSATVGLNAVLDPSESFVT